MRRLALNADRVDRVAISVEKCNDLLQHVAVLWTIVLDPKALWCQAGVKGAHLIACLGYVCFVRPGSGHLDGLFWSGTQRGFDDNLVAFSLQAAEQPVWQELARL